MQGRGNKYNSRTNKGIFFSKQTVSLNISNIQDIGNIVIPFFDIYPASARSAFEIIEDN